MSECVCVCVCVCVCASAYVCIPCVCPRSPNASLLAACSVNDHLHAIRVWGLATGEPFAVLRGHVDTVCRLQVCVCLLLCVCVCGD